MKKVVVAEPLSEWMSSRGVEGGALELVSATNATGTEDLFVGERVEEAPAGVPMCLILGSGSSKNGTLFVQKDTFDADPEAWIECGLRMAEQQRETERLAERAEMFREVEKLMSTAEIEDTFRIAAETALGFLGAEKGRLLMYDSFEERYRAVWSNDETDDSTEYLPGVSTELLQEAMENQGDFAYEASPGKGWQIVIPLRSDEDPIGVFACHLDGEVSDADGVRASRWIRMVTLILSSAFHLTRSNELAMKDDLTRAFNRRFFESYLDQEIERGARYGTIFSVIFLDLDNLKGVNDKHGHMSGSRTLQEVAKRILGAVRAIDKVIRFGGDEFCIILPQTDEEQAKAVAQRVKTAISDRRFDLDDDVVVDMTASFGIATFPKHAESKEDLIRTADAAMYRVKASSKNAIGVAGV